MELTVLALFLASTPQALSSLALPSFTTIDGQSISHAEGTAALRTGQAMLVGGLLVGTFASLQDSHHPLSVAA